MLFILDDELIPYIESKALSVKELHTIEKLISAYSDRRHFLYISPKLLKVLIKSPQFSYTQNRTLNLMLNELLRNNDLLELPYSVRLFKSVDYNVRTLSDFRKEYQISLNDFNNSHFSHSPVLICESYKDCDFYFKSALLINDKYKFIDTKGMNFDFDKYHGGGNDIHHVLDHSFDRKKIVALIADSDRVASGSECGKTASQILAILEKEPVQLSIANIQVLNVREKENLIPPNLYSIIPNSGKKDLLHDLSLIYDNANTNEYYYYLDIKDGVKYSKLETCEKTKFLMTSIYDESYHTELKSFSSFDNFTKKLTDKSYDKDETIFDGVGDLIDKVVTYSFGNGLDDYINHRLISYKDQDLAPGFKKCISDLQETKKKLEDSTDILPEYLYNEWKNIIIPLLGYFCCPIKIA